MNKSYFKDPEQLFISEFKDPPAVAARAPGRVNLIGEHTDYNGGFVLPAAIEYEIQILAAPVKGNKVELYSVNFQGKDSFDLQKIEKSMVNTWSNYIRGIIKEFQHAGFMPEGFKALISGNIPVGSGLSSSAAIEVATALMLSELFNFNISKKDMALLCQRAENNFVGVKCGIMDQYISVLGEKDHALLIDCRDLSYKKIPLPLEGYSLVICDSMASRELAGSAYNRRRKECDDGVNLLKKFYPEINSLRDVDIEDFKKVEEKIPMPVRKRCRHVISENHRTLRAADALMKGDLKLLGELMKESHISLRDDYEVSSEYLDCLVEEALSRDECEGSRLTGAGFGGCTVNLVQTEGLTEFTSKIKKIYKEKTGKTAEIYVTQASSGGHGEKYYKG